MRPGHWAAFRRVGGGHGTESFNEGGPLAKVRASLAPIEMDNLDHTQISELGLRCGQTLSCPPTSVFLYIRAPQRQCDAKSAKFLELSNL